MISFQKFSDKPEDVQKAVKGTECTAYEWVALTDTIDEWSDFATNSNGQLVRCFRDDMDFHYLFREGKPIIVFFSEPKEDEHVPYYKL